MTTTQKRLLFAACVGIVFPLCCWLTEGDSSPLRGWSLNHGSFSAAIMFLNFPAVIAAFMLGRNVHQPSELAFFVASFAQWFGIAWLLSRLLIVRERKPVVAAITQSEYSFAFVITHRDVTDAMEAGRTLDTGMRGFAFAALGLMWLVGAIAVTISATRTAPAWLPLVWLVLGVLIVWSYVIRPFALLAEMRSKTPLQQSLIVKVDESGIVIEAPGVATISHGWEDVRVVVPSPAGIGFLFNEAPNHWVPDRAFSSREEREGFLAFVDAQMLPGGQS